MSEVYNDPEKLVQLSRKLIGQHRFWNGAMDEFEARLRALGNTWQDQEYQQFAALQKKTKRMMKEFSEELRHVSKELEADAEALRAVQNVRPGNV